MLYWFWLPPSFTLPTIVCQAATMPTEQPCETCKQRPAVVHVTRLLDGREEQHHFCDICGAAQLPPRGPGQRASSGWSITLSDGRTTWIPDDWR